MPEEEKDIEEKKPESDDLEKKDNPEEKKPPAEEDEPERRRSAKDYIIERKNKKIEKLEKKNNDDDDYDNDITPEGKKAIEGGIDERVKPLIEGMKSNADVQELKDALQEFPEAKGMEKTIKKYMKAYPDTSVKFIVEGLLGRKARLEALRKKADEETDDNKIEGSSRRGKGEGKIPDAKDMSDKEFDKLDKEVMSGKYLPK